MYYMKKIKIKKFISPLNTLYISLLYDPFYIYFYFFICISGTLLFLCIYIYKFNGILFEYRNNIHITKLYDNNISTLI